MLAKTSKGVQKKKGDLEIGNFDNRRGAVIVVDTGSGKAEVVKPVSSEDAFIFVSAEYAFSSPLFGSI